MIHWMIFSTLSAGLLYGLYCLTFRRDRWLRLSLWYLLTVLAFSVLVPLLPLPEIFSSASQSVVPTGEYMVMLDEVNISDTSASVRLMDILPTAYVAGFAVCLAFLLFQMVVQAVIIVTLRRKHPVYHANDGYAIPRGASLILPDDDTAPYSFFNQIVVGTRGLGDDELRCILAHESFHVRHFHSFDLLYTRVMCCIAWFNPFVWLLMREMRAVHEFQADAASVGTCGRDNYLFLLYRQVTGTGYGHITNNFQSINIKKRIVMMNKTKTRFGAWKMLAALPVAALLMMVGCKPAGEKTVNQEEDMSVVNVTVDDVDNDETVFNVVEVDPEFPGGMEALYKYLSENIRYPEQAKNEKIQGRVFISFVVEKDGSITDAKVIRGIGGGCDEEGLRVVNAMPKWTPGKQLGKAVRVQFNLPINFKLQ